VPHDFSLSDGEEIISVTSGEFGDFVIQTSSRIFYGKEGYKSTICEDLDFSAKTTDIVHLQSFKYIYIIRGETTIVDKIVVDSDVIDAVF